MDRESTEIAKRHFAITAEQIAGLFPDFARRARVPHVTSQLQHSRHIDGNAISAKELISIPRPRYKNWRKKRKLMIPDIPIPR